jgi:hypothetical protein
MSEATLATATALRDVGKPAMALRLAQRDGPRRPADSSPLRLRIRRRARSPRSRFRALNLSPFPGRTDPAGVRSIPRATRRCPRLDAGDAAVGASYAKSEGIGDWETVLLISRT